MHADWLVVPQWCTFSNFNSIRHVRGACGSMTSLILIKLNFKTTDTSRMKMELYLWLRIYSKLMRLVVG